MPVPSIPGYNRLSTPHKLTAVGAGAAIGAAAIAFAVVPGESDNDSPSISARPAALDHAAFGSKTQFAGLHQQSITAEKEAKAARQKSADKSTVTDAVDKDKPTKKKPAKEKDKDKPAADRSESASRSADRKPVYANNLDGWIKESLDVMKSKGIPGSYNGIYRNIIRESGGNPQIVNNWDINAQMGIPSKGLLQVIPPTFQTWHVEGTSWNIFDPVANITAACNYAADRYGSMDNVNSAY